MFTNGTFTKNFGTLGSPGGEKTSCGMYVIIYIISKVLKYNATTMVCKRALHICGIHDHLTKPIPINKNITPHHSSELGLFNLLKKAKKM